MQAWDLTIEVSNAIDQGRPQVSDDAIASTAMLGLSGFRVLAVSEHAGEVEQAVETTAERGWCPACGAQARLHDRRSSWVRDLPAAGRSVTLVWVKRVWRCHERLCPQVTWTERHNEVRSRASMTERARREACRRVGQDGHTVAAVAGDFGVGWATIMGCVREYGAPLVEDPARLAGVHALGVDETAFLAATPTTGTVFATGIVALNGRARVLDVVAGRTGSALSAWVCARDDDWRSGITVAALDPFRGYATALRSTLPQATRVLEPSTSSSSGSTPSTPSAAACSSRPPDTAAGPVTHCSASAGCCAAATTITVSTPGRGCSPGSRPATTTSKSPEPGSPPKN